MWKVRCARLAAMRAKWTAAGLAVVALGAAWGAPAQSAPRHYSVKKSIWGPVNFNGRSQFPIYHDLGVGIWQDAINWDQVAPSRPASPRDPADPAYQWPAELDQAVREARKYRIRIALQIRFAPTWANGGRAPNWAPSRASDFADFLKAAARRYPTVKLWMIWGEPSRRQNFMPLTPERPGSRRLTTAQAAAPRRYARLLDASYAALKAVSSRNEVIGGNTFTAGDINPYNWVRYMRLPNGRRPRMDLYGHNPFTGRRPRRNAPQDTAVVDISDLPTFTRFLDRNLRGPHRHRLKLFLSEFFWPTDHANNEFPFHLTLRTQASWLADALRITRSSRRIFTLGWYSLYDDPPEADGRSVNRGLMRRSGERKPAYRVFRGG
ncbi:MAG: polysaccharide biosynthesis protein PslG [Frankiales bacterium]|nr:polysaccharide biosynthesis protein PslG [Frankiales bacterium]